MKFLICGLGSIGQRHVKNIRTLIPDASIIAFRHIRKNVSQFEKAYNIKSFFSLEKALNQKPKAAFITNPTSLHIPLALSCAKAGLDLFIEKPLSHSWQDVEILEKFIKKKRLVVMVGFMMRYNKGILKIKKLLDEKIIGNIISAQIINGEYLPSWHPWEDYKKSYSARKDLGGGVILTFTHEIDYSSWFFGTVKSVFCVINKSKILETNVEDSADILINYKNGITANLHLDYISQPPVRTVSIIGERGRIFWDYYTAKVKWYNSLKNKWFIYRYKFDRNKMFIDELKDFINCIKTRDESTNNFESAKDNLKIALACKKSGELKKVISL